MSHWIWPTTADLGLRAMAPTKERVFAEAGLGLLGAMDVTGAPTSRLMHGEWNAVLEVAGGRVDDDVLLLAWLDEVLYQAQTQGRWMLSAEIQLTRDADHAGVHAMVTYVAADELERGVEVKAVSSHGLMLSSLAEGEVLPGRGEGMPALQGPAWYADVLLDV